VARAAQSDKEPTGAAYIFVNHDTGENAIIVYPGAGGALSAADVDAAADAIRGAKVFVTQLEQPAATAQHGLEVARPPASSRFSIPRRPCRFRIDPIRSRPHRRTKPGPRP
jgi:sugar/nucleoside kinase (ribokinase family)